MGGAKRGNAHQQAGFAAGTIADDDELAADLSHGCDGGRNGRRGLERRCLASLLRWTDTGDGRGGVVEMDLDVSGGVWLMKKVGESQAIDDNAN